MAKKMRTCLPFPPWVFGRLCFKGTLALVAAALLLSACGSLAVPTLTVTPSDTLTALPNTATPTRSATCTATATPAAPTPSATPLATPTLTQLQQKQARLQAAGLKFLADTPEKADEVAQGIDYAHDPNESADNACGPLTVAILREAGYLPETAPVHDIWLLCVRDDLPNCFGMDILRKTYFPEEEYDYIRVEESVAKYNFKKNPLQPGDWLYLFAKWDYVKYPGFDHMLVVTRVDEDGAAYTVTNINRGEGFTISEELLYDPNHPKQGLFYELTNNELRGPLGMTGTGGFLLIRHK
jgi:hypothetical protein